MVNEAAGRSQYTVIVENDVTDWHDAIGDSYHYPRRYKSLLAPGTLLIHYKGKLRDGAYRASRLSEHPHYFATSIAGESRPDPKSNKGDLFADILEFRMFDAAVHYKDGSGNYREHIPPGRETNFWRNGVRQTSATVYQSILAAAGITPTLIPDLSTDDLTTVQIEGEQKRIYTTVYERNPKLRAQAVAYHGTTCFACEVNLSVVYGAVAAGYIHIHHRRPLHLTGETQVDPKVDLVPLCPTCHAIVHLGARLRSVNDVRGFLGKPPIVLGD